MIDAVVGATIMVVATTSLLFAIEVSEKAFRQSGYQLLSPSEVNLVNDLHRRRGFPTAASFEANNPNLFKN